MKHIKLEEYLTYLKRKQLQISRKRTVIIQCVFIYIGSVFVKNVAFFLICAKHHILVFSCKEHEKKNKKEPER